MNLFKSGDFKLHSGQRSTFKVDCGALTPADWKALAQLATSKLPIFGHVEGVPTGGMLLASFLSGYINGKSSRLLIVDDVLTTGESMEEQRAGREAMGLVVFARAPLPAWITAIWQTGVGPI